MKFLESIQKNLDKFNVSYEKDTFKKKSKKKVLKKQTIKESKVDPIDPIKFVYDKEIKDSDELLDEKELKLKTRPKRKSKKDAEWLTDAIEEEIDKQEKNVKKKHMLKLTSPEQMLPSKITDPRSMLPEPCLSSEQPENGL